MIAIVAIVYIQGLHIGWEYFLVLQVFCQRDAARHDGCELDVVHSIGTGVFGQVFFDYLAPNPTNASDKASYSCGVEDRFDELVVRHGVSIHRVFKIRPWVVLVQSLCLRLLAPGEPLVLWRHCDFLLLGQWQQQR